MSPVQSSGSMQENSANVPVMKFPVCNQTTVPMIIQFVRPHSAALQFAPSEDR